MYRFFRFLPTKWWSWKAWVGWKEYVKWRMETYGVYHPDGKFNRKNFWMMIKHMPRYHKWLGQMDRMKQ